MQHCSRGQPIVKMGNAHGCTSKGAMLLVAAANGDAATAQEVGGGALRWAVGLLCVLVSSSSQL